MYRTVNNGQLRKEDVGRDVIMCGWVQKSRDLGGMTFIDLRDRYGITQLVFNTEINPKLCELAKKLGIEVDSDSFHDSVYDVEITKKCLLKLLNGNYRIGIVE